MKSVVSSLFDKLYTMWGVKKEFRIKVLLLTLTFFMLTACQAIWRPLKTSVFISIIGAHAIPEVKLLLMIPLIILILLYSKLVDSIRRHQVFYWFAISHAIVGIFFYFVFTNATHGLTTTHVYRWIIWFFYLFLESFGAFMSATFWAFANSINNPKDAKQHYSLFVSGSKVGGILGAGSLCYLSTYSIFPDKVLIPTYLLIGSFLLLCAAGSVYLLMKYVPGYLMHGYEAAYQYEKTRVREEEKKSGFYHSFKEGFEGLWLIFKNPYVFGISSIIISYEIIIAVFDYLFALAAESQCHTIGQLASVYSAYQVYMHAVGLIIALFGTSPIQRFLGIRLSLFACPVLSIIVILCIPLFPVNGVFFAYVALRALSYGLNHPTREALFIPTTKAIKFKAKAWTDAFGTRIGKATASALNMYVFQGILRTSAIFSIGVTAVWITVAYFLGRTFQKAVNNNKVIGAEDTIS